jgi:hypothetical protein
MASGSPLKSIQAPIRPQDGAPEFENHCSRVKRDKPLSLNNLIGKETNIFVRISVHN